MKKNAKNYASIVFGVILCGGGIFLIKNVMNPQGFIKAVLYLCIGLGCGVFGHGIGNIVSRKVLGADKGRQKQIEIEKKDERNITIINKAKAKAFDVMTYLRFGIDVYGGIG